MIITMMLFIVAAVLILYACCLSPVAERVGGALFPEPFEQDIRRYEAKEERRNE